MFQWIGAILLVVGPFGATVSATPTKECAYSNYRLPQHIVPKNYDLLLDVNTEEHTYAGSMKIELGFGENKELMDNNMIVLNVHPDVEVFGVTYFDVTNDLKSGSSNRDQIQVVNKCRDDENELLVITLARGLVDPTKGHLSLLFEAKIRDDDTGIYRSNYTTQAGSDSYYISTDFQPNKARRAFPCFDEPSFKATFDIKIRHDQASVALANTALLMEEMRKSRKESMFKTTPLMSIHLVAFAIGEFEHIEKALDGGGPTIRAYTPVGKSQQAQFALDTAVRAFTYLEQYFNVPLQLDKIDMLTGVGHNGVRGNWGLIFCNETRFLFDDENSSPIYKGYITQTVVNGLSQQWFGNLVTLKWWNDLWLQEGFNTWMGYNLTNYLYPDLQWEQNYLIVSHQRALELDSQADTHPVRVAEVGKHNIDGLLDELVRLKSTAIIKFLHDVYVEPDEFRDGIKLYMENHQYGNAKASDLWNKLQDVSKLPVDKFIESWTEQSGHPLVMVKAFMGRVKKSMTSKLVLEQKRERPASAHVNDGEQTHQTWMIPLTIELSDGDQTLEMHKFNLDEHKALFSLPDWFDSQNNNHWMKVNADFRGFYHVQLSSYWSLRLKDLITWKKLSTCNRIGLLDDFKALYRSDLLTTSYPYTELLLWYREETEGLIRCQLDHAYSLIPSPSPKMITTRRNFLISAYDQTSLSSEQLLSTGTSNGMGVMDSYGLVVMFSTLLDWNHKPLVDEALALFDMGKKAAPIIRELVYKAVAKYGSEGQIRKLQFFRLAPNNCIEEKNRFDEAFAIVSKRKLPLGFSYSATLDPKEKRQRLN